MTKQDAFDIFRRVAGHIWENADFALVATTLDPDTQPLHDYLAALVHSERGARAFGDILFRRPASYRLRVAPRLLALPEATVRAVMVHEAVHLGHAKHGAEFRELCRKHGGMMSERTHEQAGAIIVERKEGHRFKAIKGFNDEAEARAWVRQQARESPGRYRMVL